MWQFTLRLPADRNQFSSNRNGNLFRRHSTDIETNRCMYAFEQLGRKPLALEFAEDCDGLSLRSDHSDITRLGTDRPSEDAHVVPMPSSYDYDVGRLADVESFHRSFKVVRDDFLRFREAFTVRVRLAVVDHDHVEARVFGRLVEAGRHVAGAKDIKQRCRKNWLKKDVECAAAHQSRVVFRIL